MDSPTCCAIRHVAFEDLGALQPALERAGYRVRYWDIGIDPLNAAALHKAELLVVLGGPIGAHEDDRYPFLREELALIETRLAENRPLLGICLGAQLIARVLGASVRPCVEKEIGFAPLRLTDEGRASSLLPFDDAPVLHWHGDCFDLPYGATRLAWTPICQNQAFALGANVLAVQFHPEAGMAGFERWLIGHTVELNDAGIEVGALRREHDRLSAGLVQRADSWASAWLRQLTP